MLPGREGKQWAFRSRMTPPPATILEQQLGGKMEGSTLGPVGPKLSLSPISTREPDGTFGTPGRPGCERRVDSASDFR